VILSVFAVLLTVGFGTWLLGHVFEYTEIAALGAVIVVAAGGIVAVDGLQYQSGEHVEKDYYEFEKVDGSGQVVNNQSTTSYEYSDISWGVRVNLGALVMFIGAFLFGRRLEEVSFGGG
jgi:hypothetical protein